MTIVEAGLNSSRTSTTGSVRKKRGSKGASSQGKDRPCPGVARGLLLTVLADCGIHRSQPGWDEDRPGG